MKEGAYYDLPEETYHADPCVEPSLSASIIKPLLDQSPWHAWFEHPQLNPDYESETSTTFDIGRAAHSMILKDPKDFEIVDAPDWRKKEAQEKRDAAYEAGKIPLLAYQHEEVQRMVKAGREQIAAHECSNAFVDGKSEVTLIWQEGDVWCRCRIDHCAENGKDFYDYKTTDQYANPKNAGRGIFNLGYDITSAFYRRGIRKVLKVQNPNYRFVIQEKKMPYALSVVALDPAAEGLADRKIDEAIRLWGECLNTDTWPGYTNRIAYVGAPAWHEQSWLLREACEQAQEIEKGHIGSVFEQLKTKTLTF